MCISNQTWYDVNDLTHNDQNQLGNIATTLDRSHFLFGHLYSTRNSELIQCNLVSEEIYNTIHKEAFQYKQILLILDNISDNHLQGMITFDCA